MHMHTAVLPHQYFKHAKTSTAVVASVVPDKYNTDHEIAGIPESAMLVYACNDKSGYVCADSAGTGVVFFLI